MEGEVSASFYHLPSEEVITALGATPVGLSQDEAAIRLKKSALNSLKTRTGSTSLTLFLSQFKSPVTILLIIAALLSIVLRDISDAGIILFIILVSSLLSFWQERGANRAMAELLKIVQTRSVTLRDGKETEVPSEEIVPGDIILLRAGDIVPGDSLLLDSEGMYTDEAAFTGETFPVEKKAGILPVDTLLSARTNTLLMGSHLISGKGRALVVITGKDTQFGLISARLRSGPPETAFERGIQQLGYMLMEITMVLVVIIFGTNVLMHRPALDSLLFSLALAVGLTPQLLPAIISINLAAGAREMAKSKVIVKRLSAIENLGSMNILCSDKTGTITTGKVTLKDALDVDGNYSEKTLRYAWLNAVLQKGYVNPIDQAIQASYQGDAGEYSIQTEIAYDFFRKRLSIQVRRNGENMVLIKGAFNAIIEVCSSVELPDGKIVAIGPKLADISERYRNLSCTGYRVLGLAWKNGINEKNFTRDDEKELIFLGFIVLFDPLKPDVQKTIKVLQGMGVQLKVITGDNSIIAVNLARQIGIEQPVVLTGRQIQEMSNNALLYQVQQADIFAEVAPNQKERIVGFLKKSGNIVGFMGDGINDAPALHIADVGISVDTAVDVAKEAADIVLLNQSLEVLSKGIAAGRKTFTNTMKYIFMATSANFGNMFSMAGASLLLPFLPLLPKQILLNNLLTDFPEMMIAGDKVDDIAVAKPHKWEIGFLRKFMIIFGLLSSVFDFVTFGILLFVLKADMITFRTYWFVESVVSATLIVLVMRTRLLFFRSLPAPGMLVATVLVLSLVILLPSLPLAGYLGFGSIQPFYYGWMWLIVTCYIISGELMKRWFYRKSADK